MGVGGHRAGMPTVAWGSCAEQIQRRRLDGLEAPFRTDSGICLHIPSPGTVSTPLPPPLPLGVRAPPVCGGACVSQDSPLCASTLRCPGMDASSQSALQQTHGKGKLRFSKGSSPLSRTSAWEPPSCGSVQISLSQKPMGSHLHAKLGNVCKSISLSRVRGSWYHQGQGSEGHERLMERLAKTQLTSSPVPTHTAAWGGRQESQMLQGPLAPNGVRGV